MNAFLCANAKNAYCLQSSHAIINNSLCKIE